MILLLVIRIYNDFIMVVDMHLVRHFFIGR